jgi:hypothetical protein
MAFKTGEKYRCPDPDCGCEIQVTKGAAPGKGGDQQPRCCCGKEMEKIGECHEHWYGRRAGLVTTINTYLF